MKESAQNLTRYGVDPRDYDEARFAICAWIDESILVSPWMHRTQWQSNMLQSEFYHTVNAGSEFFDHLNQLHPEQNSVREIFFLCLGFGFMGRYSLEGDEFLLEQLKKSNLRSLTGKVSEPLAYAKEAMFQNAYLSEGGKKGRFSMSKSNTSKIRLLLWSIPPLVLLTLFFIYTFVLNGVVDNLLLRVTEG